MSSNPCILGIAAAMVVWTTQPAWAEVGDDTWDKEGVAIASNLPLLKISTSPVLRVGAGEPYKDVASAIAALSSAGGTVLIAKGTYEIGESLRVPSHVALIGDGKDTKLRMKPGVLAHVITNADHVTGNTDILVRDLSIVGNLDSRGTPPGPDNPVRGNDNCRGIYFNHVGGAQVLNCFITETGTNSLFAENSQDIVLVRCEEMFCFHCLNFTRCKNVTVAYCRAIRKWSGEAPYFNNTRDSKVFKNCVKGMGMDGMAFDFGSSYNDVHDNLVMGSNLSGIRLAHNANHNTIRDNTIGNSGAFRNNPMGRMDGIHLGTGASNNTLSGNHCLDDQPVPTQRYGICISEAACRDNTIRGNIFSGKSAGKIHDLGTNNAITN